MKRLPIITSVLMMIANFAYANPTQKSDIDEPAARLIFTQLLGDAKKAQGVIDTMWLLAKANGQEPTIVLNLSRRLIIWGWPAGELSRIIRPSADAAAAIGLEPAEFAEIVLTLGEMLKDDHDDSRSALSALDRLGVPVYDILGEVASKRPSEIKEYASRGEIKSRPAMELILNGFEKRYAGLAAKLTEQKRK
jgi:hypothetical protein